MSRDADVPAAHDLERMLSGALHTPAAEAARVVALHWLAGLAAARDALRPDETSLRMTDRHPVSDTPGLHADDADMLHRARVALRRLRATIRSYRSDPDIRMDVGRRSEKRLRKLNHATNAARDADVQHAWLSANYEALSDAAQKDAAEMFAHLAEQQQKRAARVERAFRKYFDPHLDGLRASLVVYRVDHVVGQPVTPRVFASALAEHVVEGGARIRLALEAERESERESERETEREAAQSADTAVNKITSEREATLHALRIQLKRQRAMLQPFTRSSDEVAAWYALATRGQDALGAMRDANSLAIAADEKNLSALAASARAQSRAHLGAFHAAWSASSETINRVLEPCTVAAVALRRIAADALVPREIERKFLLRAMPPHAFQTVPLFIEQGWLPGTRLRERLRKTTRPDGDVARTRTVKVGALGNRIELEEPVDDALFDAMWPFTGAARIRKHRHVVSDGEVTWEIDTFIGRDLVLAEVELREGQAVPAFPDWLAPYVMRDVTDDVRYTNSALAAG